MSQSPPARAFPAELPTDGEIAALMRARDWSSSPLGEPADWPQPLVSALSLMLGSRFPMFLAWGPELTFLYNDAYAELVGAKHPAALGGRFQDVWSEVWSELSPMVDSALAGQAVFREDLALRFYRFGAEEQAWFTFSYSPLKGADGAVAGMFCAVAESSAKVRSERRHAFRTKLDEALAGLDDPRAIMEVATAALGRHLRAQRVGYSQMLPDGETGVLEACYADGVASLTGVFRLAHAGPASVARQAGGATEVCDDVTTDPEQVQETWARIETRAFVSVPLVREGRLRASLYVNFRAPHRWSPEEVGLIEYVAARTWDAVERARAENELRESEVRFRNMADHAPVMMWVTDQDGYCSYLNRAWYEFTGQTEAEALGYGWLEATHPDDKAMTEAAFREANAARAPFRTEYRLRRADGTYRWAIDAAAPRFGEGGEYLGYVGSVIDIQDRQEAEEQLRLNEARLRSLMNAVPAFVWLGDAKGSIHFFNDRWYDYTGQTPAEAQANGWVDVVHPDDVERTLREWLHALSHGLEYQIELRYRRRDGDYRWYLARAEPVRDSAGRITAWLGASIDTHESKLAAEHQQLLINELNHRVKNTLATVQSMAAQTVRGGGDPRESHAAFMSRLMALSAAHNVLTERRWAGALLHDVVDGAARTFSERPGDRFRTQGPPVWLPPKAALALAMALHELGTNASKYGSLSVAEGSVVLDWTVAASPRGRRLDLTWTELGGPPVTPPAAKGFGSRLLERGLAGELGGAVTLDFRPGGLVCRIEADLVAEGGETAFA